MYKKYSNLHLNSALALKNGSTLRSTLAFLKQGELLSGKHSNLPEKRVLF